MSIMKDLLFFIRNAKLIRNVCTSIMNGLLLKYIEC
jgi:hypothetical protein